MNDREKIKSKVLTFDTDISILPRLRKIFDANNLTGMRSIGDPGIVDIILDKNIHLGAIFTNNSGDWEALCLKLKQIRPELPLFLRVENPDDPVPEEINEIIDGHFHISEEGKITNFLRNHIFIRDYPLEMISRIREFSMNALVSMIPGVDIVSSAPLVIRDKIIYGEITTLIPVNTNWCRGYMMVQSDMENLHTLLNRTGSPAFRGEIDQVVPPLMGELTNLMWGGFKTVFLKEGFLEEKGADIQVPIIVNHNKHNISFGGDTPQLCFEYRLKDPIGLKSQTKIVQKFIFNLNWNPDLVAEYDFQTLIEEGDIQLF